MLRSADDNGAVTVEFALLLPLLLLLLCGIIDFGRAYHAQLTLTHAAREGIRVLALDRNATLAELQQAYVDDSLLAPGLDVTVATDPSVSTTCADGATFAYLQVETTFTFATPLPELSRVFSDDPSAEGLTIRGKAAMRCGG